MRIQQVVVVMLAAAGCASGGSGGGGGDDTTPEASCGDQCDTDGDGVPDGIDQCANTPAGEMVNRLGCSDSQLMPTLVPMFPPFGLVWTNAGDLGRAGGLTWTYDGIMRGDLFHIYWILCDDPLLPCGLSLDGPIDRPSESWQFNTVDSAMPAGKVVFKNTTAISLDGGGSTGLEGRLTVTIVDAMDVPLP